MTNDEFYKAAKRSKAVFKRKDVILTMSENVYETQFGRYFYVVEVGRYSHSNRVINIIFQESKFYIETHERCSGRDSKYIKFDLLNEECKDYILKAIEDGDKNQEYQFLINKIKKLHFVDNKRIIWPFAVTRTWTEVRYYYHIVLKDNDSGLEFDLSPEHYKALDITLDKEIRKDQVVKVRMEDVVKTVAGN